MTTLKNNIWTRNDEIKSDIAPTIRTGLVVQGGCMRGTYSMAALMALEECGLGGAFDHVIGSSAGAINGAYLLAEQAKLAVSVYLDDISNRRFVNFMRFSKVVDIDYLVDEVLSARKVLDVETLRNSRSTLHIVLTDYLTADPVFVTNRDDSLKIMEAIRATAAMPILYNRVVNVNGRGYIDGGIADSIPLQRAIDLGCTDILVVLTRKPSHRRSRPGMLTRMIEYPFLRHYPKQTKEKLFAEDVNYNRTMGMIENAEKHTGIPRIQAIYPSDLSKMASRTTNDRCALLDCALMARNDTRRFFGLDARQDNPFD